MGLIIKGTYHPKGFPSIFPYDAQVDPDATCQARDGVGFSMVEALKVSKAEEETKLIYIYMVPPPPKPTIKHFLLIFTMICAYQGKQLWCQVL